MPQLRSSYDLEAWKTLARTFVYGILKYTIFTGIPG